MKTIALACILLTACDTRVTVPGNIKDITNEVEVVCLNGVQYYAMTTASPGFRDLRARRTTVGDSLAPKYTPTFNHPDVCP